MPALDRAVVFNGLLSGATGPVARGIGLLYDEDADRLVIATDANRTATGRKTAGIALTEGDDDLVEIEVQFAGPVDPSITGLGAGTATTIYINSSGAMARGGTVGVDDIIGRCDTDGTAYIMCGGIAGAAGGATVPGGSVGDVQIKGSSTTFSAVSPGTSGNVLTSNGTAWTSAAPASGASVTAGDGIRVTGGPAYTIHGVKGTCSLEQFGAVGDGSTDDSAALTAALAAISAGTYGTLVLGAKTYLVPTLFTVPTGCIIVGQGDASVLKTTANTTLLRCAVDALNITLASFKLLGNDTGAAQHAVEVGRDGIAGTGVNRFRAINLTVEHFGGYGLAFSRPPQSNSDLYYGPQIHNCRIRYCGKGILCTQAAEYGKVTNTDVRDCTEHGVWIGAGNWSFTGCNINANAVNVTLRAGTNDTHGQFVSCSINHPSGATNLHAEDGITQGHNFIGCHLYEGDWSIGAFTCILNFVGCIVDPETVTNAGSLRFTSCLFPADYFVAWNESGNGWTQFINPIDAQDGTLPSFVEARVHRTFTFSSDANQTLTWPESVAEVLRVASGTISTTRQITSQWGPEPGRKVGIVNNNAQDVTFKWSSGTAVTIPAGKTAVVGADGTNAIFIVQPDSSGGSGAPTDASYVVIANNAGLSAERALAVSSPLTLSDGGANGSVTLSFSAPGTNTQLYYRSAGALATTPNAGYDGTGLTINSSGYLALGTTPATTGAIRLTNNTGIYSMLSGGTDHRLIDFTSGDLIQVGHYANGSANVVTYTANAGYISFETQSSALLKLQSANALLGVPVLGNTVMSAPWSVHGDTSVDIANADHTLTAAEYQYTFLTITSTPVMTADRTVTFPAPSSGQMYWKLVYVDNTTLNGHDMHFTTGSGATVETTGGVLSKLILLCVSSAGIRSIPQL